MNRLVNFSVKHPLSILMYILLITIFGLISVWTIKVDYLPYISDKTLLITTSCDGLPAQQMKQLVTIPEEDVFSSLKGIKTISSVTRDSLSFIKIELQPKTNINTSLLEARQTIDQFYQTLPEKSNKPKAEIFSTDKNYLMTIAVIPPQEKLSQARYTIEKHIIHELQKIKGCGKISVSGGLKDQITIETDINLLALKNLSIEDIAAAIENTNFEYPAGTIKDESNEYIFKTSCLYSSPEQILETLICKDNNIFKLSDFASVKNDFVKKESFCLYNSSEAIEIEISKKSEESPVTISEKIKNYLSTLKSKYPDYEFRIIDDESIEIKNSILIMYISAVLGMIICFIILYLFYRQFRIALTVSSVIPFCILFSVSVLKLLGKNLNLFSLSGISISLGMIVDPAIILIRKISLQTQASKNRATSFDEIILHSSEQIQKSNLSSSLTTIIVFFPFFLLPAIFGELFSDLSIAVIASIFFSFILSLTYIPSVTKLFLKNQITQIKNPPVLNSIQDRYNKIIFQNLTNKKLIYKTLLISILISIPLILSIKKEVLPLTDSQTFSFSIEYPSNQSLQNIQSQTEKLNDTLLNSFPKTTVYSKGGIDCDNYFKLADYKNTKSSVQYTVTNITRKQIKQIKNLLTSQNIQFTPIQKSDIISRALNLTSTCLVQFTQTENNNSNFSSYGFTDYKPDYKTNEISFIPDTNKCSYYHIPKYYISYYCYQILNGLDAGELLISGTYTPIKVKPIPVSTQNLTVTYENTSIPISALGNFSINQTEKILFRYNKKDTKEIPASNTSKINSQDLKILKLNKDQSSERISISILLLAIVLILLYCFLGAQFESFTLPFILLLTTIPAVTGAFTFLFIFNQSLNINSILSLVVLFGTCVNNAIIFYEAIIFKKKTISISAVCKTELSSILITTITSISALIPFTVDPFHINSQTSISIAIIGGLSASMLTTIFIYPIIYSNLQTLNKSKRNNNE
ncbi:MAG: efflux RND transporter permease subunit [Treponema sp.]|nr:efflux RND transporter permease subunit [Candidatus Treponema scatequi]